MNGETPTKRYMIVVQLDNSSDLQRVANVAPAVLTVFTSVARAEPVQVFRSSDGVLFGYLVETSAKIDFIRAEFEKSQATTNADTILVLEVGEEFTGRGFSRAWTWLQHH